MSSWRFNSEREELVPLLTRQLRGQGGELNSVSFMKPPSHLLALLHQGTKTYLLSARETGQETGKITPVI